MDRHRPPNCIVIAGGVPTAVPAFDVSGPIRPIVIAADSGVAIALDWDLDVDVAVGDFDSLIPELVERLDEIAVEVERFNPSKDDTDLALALAAAIERSGPGARVVVAGIEGGRTDHALANLALVSGSVTAGVELELALDAGRGWVVRDELGGAWDAGELISVIPMHGDAVVSITGVQWPLDHARLAAGTSLGVSNVATGGSVALTVHDGVALVISPHQLREIPA